jgi:hypothetical protein
MFPIPGSRGYLTGFGSIRATSLRLDAGTLAAPSFEIGVAGVGLYYNSGVGGLASANGGGLSFYIDSTGAHAINNILDSNQGLRLQEQTTPAGVADSAKLYAVDSGGGKTVLRVIFGSGAAQTIATEP